MERAAQSLGRINPKDDAARAAFKPKNIDLRQCNLQCFDLRDGLFFGAQFRDAHLQAVDLEGAHLQCSDLTRADLREADLRKVQLQGAMLFAVKLSAGTQIDRCNLRGVAVFFVDNVTINTLRPHWDNIIAFLAELPPGAPDHWHTVSSDSFDPDQADADWRAWASEHHPGIKIYPDYRDQDPD
ncbi:hypothetical protein LSUCC0031_11090 [Rhodobacterales bacterium LSUCC0031]|nr:hypothetical protein [Rhodobacterales bacterium LSUCC0031]